MHGPVDRVELSMAHLSLVSLSTGEQPSEGPRDTGRCETGKRARARTQKKTPQKWRGSLGCGC
jgi:hypothetical protein